MSWKACRLGDVMTLKRGHDLPEHSRQEGDVPVVSSSGITGRHKESKATAPGVVTGRYGTIGEVYFLQEDFWPLNTALYVIDFKGNDPRFSSYFLRNVLKGYQSEKAAIPGVDRNVLHEIKVHLPSLPEQLRITEILSTYDDLIDNNRRLCAGNYPLSTSTCSVVDIQGTISLCGDQSEQMTLAEQQRVADAIASLTSVSVNQV
jgi:type I restriction enzyme S subunit